MHGAPSTKHRTTPSWGVVATVLERTEILAAFAAHHLDIGASEVILFLDAASPEAEDLLASAPGVRIILADGNHFQSLMGCARPELLSQRQRLNIAHAAKISTTDWLLPLDADEFLCAEDFSAELAEVPDMVDTLRLPGGERAYIAGAPPLSVFDGVLRLPVRGKRLKISDLLSPALDLYTARGMSGHVTGKTCRRTKRRGQARAGHAQNALVCCYDGMTPGHWGDKLAKGARQGRNRGPARDAAAPHRIAQLDFAAACGGDADIIGALHDALRQLVPEEFARLQHHGLARPMPIDPLQSVRRHFPELAGRLSVEAFDAARLARFAEPGGCQAA